MKINFSNLSRGYSKAIFSISNKFNVQLPILAFLEHLNIIITIPKVQNVVFNNLLNQRTKVDFLINLINSIPAINILFKTDNVQQYNVFFDLINNFIKLLIKKNLLKLTSQILFKYNTLYLNSTNQVQINIISATLLDHNEKELILNKLIKHFNKNLIPKFTIDKTMISGVVIKYNDKVIDFSLKNKLSTLKSSLTANC